MHALLHSVPPTLQQAAANSHLPRRLLDTHGQVGVSLLWGLYSFLLGPCVHKLLFVPSKSLFPQSCVSSGSSMVGLMATSSKMAYAIPRLAVPRAPCLCSRPLLTHTSAGGTQTLKGRSGPVSVGSPHVHKDLFEPSEHLWWVWSLILNVILHLLPSCWGFSFALGHGVSFFGGIQHSPVNSFHQQVVILEFSQEKISAHPSTVPS